MHKYLITGTAALAAISALFVASPALAYQGSQGNSTFTCTPTSAAPGGTVTCTVTIKDANGNGVAGASVTFSQQSGPGSCKATFSPTSATTDANGSATVTVTLPTGCPGSYSFAAAGAGVTVTTSVSETGGFPATSADVPAPGNQPAFLLLALGLALMTFGGAAFVLRRR